MLTLCRFYRFSVNSVKHLKPRPAPPLRPAPALFGLTAPDAHVAQTRANARRGQQQQQQGE